MAAAQKYAKDQPAGFTNRVERVAVVGATGQVGAHFVKHLLAYGKHTVTALGRASSGSKEALPDGVRFAAIDYDDESSLDRALARQQFLIITLSVLAAPDTQLKLVRAAARAGIRYIVPNAFSMDMSNAKLVAESPLGGGFDEVLAEIERLGVSSWTSVVCGLWYEYSLVMGPIWFGFDIDNKKLTRYDDGATRINVTTWEQCGRAVATLAGLKELPEDEHDRSPTISRWRNRPLVVSSFEICQNDMLASWLRVTGQSADEWTIESKSSRDIWQSGLADAKAAKDPMSWRLAAARASFARNFFPRGGGEYGSRLGLDNEALDLPQEDLDERTTVAKTMYDDGYSARLMAKMTNPS